MFELLLIIYLLPVVIVAALLLRLALFLLKKSIRIALWVIRKSALILKLLVVWLGTVPSAIVRFLNIRNRVERRRYDMSLGMWVCSLLWMLVLTLAFVRHCTRVLPQMQTDGQMWRQMRN